ncbi:MAG: DUF262 domain-containing HNH endonuclease family protein [Hyphomicrobium sp.]|nr:DUF262 domain-containing HNH endonuclease family protein [Hyphomicrobium sp.]
MATGGILDCRLLTIGELLDGRYQFSLPYFQRAYAWGTRHSERLLSDIRASQARNRRYCLGRIMLAHNGGPNAEIVDGHQRLLTLTILLAVLRDRETDTAMVANLDRLIACPEGFRVSIQEMPAPLFSELVQKRGGTLADPDAEGPSLSETERIIMACRDTLAALLSDGATHAMQRRALAQHLIHNCYVVVTTASDALEAWELVATEQDTRLQFTPADRAKSDLLAATRDQDRLVCSRAWEDCEDRLSSEDMYKLLQHIRAIVWRGRNSNHTSVANEIVERFGSEKGLVTFMTDVLVKSADRLHRLRKSDDALPPSLAASVGRMGWIDDHSWVPAALYWLESRGENHREAETFFARLERLTWVLKIAGTDPGVAETRLLRLLDDMQSADSVSEMERLKIEPSLKSELVESLRRQNFAAKGYAGAVLRRISLTLGHDPGPLVRDKVTIEHIMPTNPLRTSNWRRMLRSNDEIKKWSQRLGNLTILSGEENQKVGPRDWDFKRNVYAVSSYKLAREAASEQEWNTQTIQRRTEQMIAILLREWDLGAASH